MGGGGRTNIGASKYNYVVANCALGDGWRQLCFLAVFDHYYFFNKAIGYLVKMLLNIRTEYIAEICYTSIFMYLLHGSRLHIISDDIVDETIFIIIPF